MTTVATSTGSTVDPTSAVQQAAQSIISGSTNSTMDVNSLVSAIVNAKVAGQTDALNNKKTADNTQLTAIGTLKSMLSLLQSSLTNLANGTTLVPFTATADGKGLTATAASGAVAGSYAVNVTEHRDVAVDHVRRVPDDGHARHRLDDAQRRRQDQHDQDRQQQQHAFGHRVGDQLGVRQSGRHGDHRQRHGRRAPRAALRVDGTRQRHQRRRSTRTTARRRSTSSR